MAKQKKQMSSSDKANSRARKEPRTAARKKKRREEQLTRELANKVNAARGIASPWQVACARRTTGKRGPLSGAA